VPAGEAPVDFTAFEAEPSLDFFVPRASAEPTALWNIATSAPAPAEGPAAAAPPAAADRAEATPEPAAEALEILDEDILEFVDEPGPVAAPSPAGEEPLATLPPPAAEPRLADALDLAELGGEPAPAPSHLAALATPVEEAGGLAAAVSSAAEAEAPAPPEPVPAPLAPPPDPSASAPPPTAVLVPPAPLAEQPGEVPAPPPPPPTTARAESTLDNLFAELAAEEAAAPQEAAAPAAPVTPEAPPTSGEPQLLVEGQHRVVIHTTDGQVKRGVITDAALDGVVVLLAPQAGGAPAPLPVEIIKAIFFMLPLGAQPRPPEGKRVRVTFRDGRQVAGFSSDYAPDRVGFFMVPVDTRTHTERIWVYKSAVRQVSVS